MRDLGPDLLDWYRQTCSMDDAWLVREDRSLTWMPYLFRQTVTAQPPRRSLDTDVTRIVAVTPVSTSVPESTPVELVLFGTNVQATSSAMVFDPERRAFQLGTAASFSEVNEGWLKRLFAVAAVTQVAVPHGLERAAFDLLGTPDLVAHPTSGRRDEPDDMLSVVNVIRAKGAEGPRLLPSAFASAARRLQEIGIAVRSEGEALALAVPCERLAGAVTIVLNTAEHPAFGHGLFVMQVAPAIPGEPNLTFYANDLNRRELFEPVDQHAFGAWLRGPENELNHVAFVTADLLDVPESAQAALMANLVINEMIRARWLDDTWDAMPAGPAPAG